MYHFIVKLVSVLLKPSHYIYYTIIKCKRSNPAFTVVRLFLFVISSYFRVDHLNMVLNCLDHYSVTGVVA